MKKKQEIIDLMNGDHPVVLHFYSTDCKKAKANQLVLHQLQKVENAHYVNSVNIEINKQPELEQDLEIDAAPMVVLFKQGKERWRGGGAVCEERILKAIQFFGSEN